MFRLYNLICFDLCIHPEKHQKNITTVRILNILITTDSFFICLCHFSLFFPPWICNYWSTFSHQKIVCISGRSYKWNKSLYTLFFFPFFFPFKNLCNHLRILYIVVCIDSSSLFMTESISWYGDTTVYSFTCLCTLGLFPVLGFLLINLLWTFMYMSL